MAFDNVESILQSCSPASSMKLILAAGIASRPQYSSFFKALLRPFVQHDELPVRYRCFGRSYTALLRMPDLVSDWASVKELGIDDIYRLDTGFKPDLVIDGGGNIGLFALEAAAAFRFDNRTPIVICEPLPRNIEQIRKHLSTNGIEAEIRPNCLGGTRRSIPFYCRAANQSSFDSSEPYELVMEIPVVLLEDVIGNNPAERILIKLDIEGMEIETLETFVSASEKRAIYIVGELHDFPRNRRLIEQIFHKNGWALELYDVDFETSSFRACSPNAVASLKWTAGVSTNLPA
jgi:FkbM family methyltransferase